MVFAEPGRAVAILQENAADRGGRGAPIQRVVRSGRQAGSRERRVAANAACPGSARNFGSRGNGRQWPFLCLAAGATQQSGEIGALQDATWSNSFLSRRPAVLEVHELIHGDVGQGDADRHLLRLRLAHRRAPGQRQGPDQADKVWSTLKSPQRCQPSSGVGMERPRRHLRLALNDGQVGTHRGGRHGPCDLVLANCA